MRSRAHYRVVFLAGAVLIGLAWLMAAQQPTAPKDQPRAPAEDYQLTGPYSHENLTIFLIHGKDRFQAKDVLTLPEALEQKLAVIHETQAVNELKVENLSATHALLILSGEILKGGQQDRFARSDMILPPKSGAIPLECFCVEHTAARWMRPLEGKDKNFAASPGLVASNSIRLSGRYYRNQGEVWANVAKTQEKLSMNAKKSVRAAESESSLALSLDAKEVQEATERYLKQLLPIVEDKNDAIGFAFAINGKVYSADVYGSNALFRKVWPRLLRATATEAFADLEKDKKYQAVNAAAVRSFLAEAEKGKEAAAETAGGVRQASKESPYNVRFESREEKKGEVIRVNILNREEKGTEKNDRQQEQPRIPPKK